MTSDPRRAASAHAWLRPAFADLPFLIALPHAVLFRFLVRRGDDVLIAFGAVVAAAATSSSH